MRCFPMRAPLHPWRSRQHIWRNEGRWSAGPNTTAFLNSCSSRRAATHPLNAATPPWDPDNRLDYCNAREELGEPCHAACATRLDQTTASARPDVGGAGPGDHRRGSRSSLEEPNVTMRCLQLTV